MFTRQYSDKDVKKLIKMWEEGSTAVEIGDAIGKSKYSVRQFMHRNREKYGFEKKQPGRPFLKATFDKQWHGVVPCGHWMITKPWRKVS
jgi:hypothetical protein